jgi:hypothetical protein
MDSLQEKTGINVAINEICSSPVDENDKQIGLTLGEPAGWPRKGLVLRSAFPVFSGHAQGLATQNKTFQCHGTIRLSKFHG